MKRLLLTFFASTFALGLGACNNSAAAVTSVTPSTAVQVDPAEFLGAIRCGAEAGDMQLYVATLKDVSSGRTLQVAGDLILPSAAPTSCHIPVLFENIHIGREYEASIDGYDRTDIVPLGAGSRVMVESNSGTFVAPRWTTSCGHHRYPAALRSADGGVRADAGRVLFADSGLIGADGGGYLDCRPLPLYGPRNAPYLDGPVCAGDELTVTVRGCDPLR
jgi:hypothetical protein